MIMKTYTVVQGDNLSKIARRNGLGSWRDIYYHQANASFRESNPNPNLIYPGDIIHIPSPEEVIPTQHNAQRNRTPRQRRTRMPNLMPAIPNNNGQTSPDEEDETDLAEAPIRETINRVQANPALRQWRSHIISFLSRANRNQVQNWMSRNSYALLFGKANVRLPGNAEWAGEQVYDGYLLPANARVNTRENGDAVIITIPDFTIVRLQANRLFLVERFNSSPIRRRSTGGDNVSLLRGRLREGLAGLRGTE